MKVIFLDIDGVLNSDDYIDIAKNSQGIERHIDIDKVKLLKKAIDETGAKTVLTSSWRNSKDIGPLREFLAKYEIYDSFDKEMLRHLVKVSDANGRGLGEGLTQKDIDTIIKRFGRVKEDFER